MATEFFTWTSTGIAVLLGAASGVLLGSDVLVATMIGLVGVQDGTRVKRGVVVAVADGEIIAGGKGFNMLFGLI